MSVATIKNDLGWAATAGATGYVTGMWLLSENPAILGGACALDSLLASAGKKQFDRLAQSHKNIAPFINHAARMALIAGAFHFAGVGVIALTAHRVSVIAVAILSGTLGKRLFEGNENVSRTIEAVAIAVIKGSMLSMDPARMLFLASIYATRSMLQFNYTDEFQHYDLGTKDDNAPEGDKKVAFVVNSFAPLGPVSVAGAVASVALGLLALSLAFGEGA